MPIFSVMDSHETATLTDAQGRTTVALSNARLEHLMRLLNALQAAQANRDYRSSIAIRHFQIALQDLGFGQGLAVNGVYDPATGQAVTLFQQQNGLSVDGDVGNDTCAGLIQGVQALIGSAFPGTVLTPANGTITATLYNYYGNSSNYDSVYRDVMGWYGTTSDGCAAFLSTALRHIHISVPHGAGRNGYDISLVAQSLAEWLIDQGWSRHTNPSNLQPGDVIVTEDDPRFPGFAAHIYMFAGWVNQASRICEAVDNQGFRYDRNVGQGPKTPMRYFLRA